MFDLSAYRRQLDRMGRGEPLQSPPTLQDVGERQQAGVRARLAAAEQAEVDRLKRVKALAPKAKKWRRELEAAQRACRDAEAGRDAAQRTWDAAFAEQSRLSNIVGQLEWGTDVPTEDAKRAEAV